VRKFFSILTILFCVGSLQAQNRISVVGFERDDADQSARITDVRTDQNSRKAAIVRIVTTLQLTDCSFEAGLAGVVASEQRKGEIWLWLPVGAQRLTIVHSSLGDVRNYPFGAPLREATVYVMRLQSETPRTDDDYVKGQFLVARCETQGASIEIEGFARETFSNGVFQKYLPLGTYRYTVDAPMYISENGEFEIVPTEKTTKTITLKPNFSNITLTGDGEIFVNEERRGSGSWTGVMTKGLYRVEVRKPACRNSVQTINVEAGYDRTFNLSAPVPIYGELRISANAIADIFIDEKNTGRTTPDAFNEIAIGNHSLRLTASGFRDYRQTVEVKEGQITEITAVMEPLPKKTDEKTKTPKPETKKSETVKPKPETSASALRFHLQYSGETIAPLGLTLGVSKRQFGGYVQAISSLPKKEESVLPDGVEINFDKPAYSHFAFTGGLMYQVAAPVWVYAGGGYATYKVGYSTSQGGYCFLAGNMAQGFKLEAGAKLVLINHLTISLGVGAVPVKTDVSVGGGMMTGLQFGVGWIF